MGRLTTSMLLENVLDLHAAHEGKLSPDLVRRIEVSDALVDTGATTLTLRKAEIDGIGLKSFSTRRCVTSAGVREVKVYGPVRVTILDRSCSLDVMEVPDDVPALVGQIPLEMLDLVVDPPNRRLIGNPAHGGIHTLELY
jgi:predicted aspartyl protease